MAKDAITRQAIVGFPETRQAPKAYRYSQTLEGLTYTWRLI